ncbi:MAG: ABC transporter ATP-binding protein [Rhizobiales bacterium]|nr:ABC transporter ATP-binding protein [Hyphomicrobiales bacterium]
MIEISQLTKTFDGRAVLDALTLRIAERDRIALVGSNGAGKTTLFRCLLGHYTYDGTISINGESARRRDPALLSRVAFVPQLPPPLRMPVGELLRFAHETTGARHDTMTEMAGRLGIDLATVSRQPFYRLSGGQKQKILVTVALAREADLLIFDEPSANLDPAARGAFIELLATRDDCAMLIASHRLEEVAPLVNRVVELDRGRVVLDDAVADRLAAGEQHSCMVVLREMHEPMARAFLSWGMTAKGDLTFTGHVPAAESFRFLSMLSRYAGLVEKFSMDVEGKRRKGG